MNLLHLIWIVPLTGLAGWMLCALCAAATVADLRAVMASLEAENSRLRVKAQEQARRRVLGTRHDDARAIRHGMAAIAEGLADCRGGVGGQRGH